MAEGRWWSLGSGTEGLSAKRVAGTLWCEGSIPALTELCSSRARFIACKSYLGKVDF